jgi:hypothetical protein
MLGAAIAFAGPAFADKMKATLDGKAQVPPNTSAATGTADLDYDPASKKLSWKLSYSGLSGPATAAHFHGPAEAGQECRRRGRHPQCDVEPGRGQRHVDRCAGRGPRSRQVLHQHSHRSQSGRRNPRSGNQVDSSTDEQTKTGRTLRAPALFLDPMISRS